jgi:hypothetical protein
MGGHVKGERRERQQGEEPEVVEQGGDSHAEQSAVAQRAERVGECRGVFGTRRRRQQEAGDDE